MPLPITGRNYDQLVVEQFATTPNGYTAVRTAKEIPKDILFDPNDVAPIYIGLSFNTHNASTASSAWTIYKFTYNGSTQATRIQVREGRDWDNRASYF